MDGALIRQDQDACFFLCNDVNVTLTTDSSLVTSLQVDNGARKCSSYRTSQRCDGPVYYLQRKEKRVYVVDGSQSRWWNTMRVCKSTCVDSTPRLTPHMSRPLPPPHRLYTCSRTHPALGDDCPHCSGPAPLCCDSYHCGQANHSVPGKNL